MSNLPSARLGAPRRVPRTVDDHAAVSVHLSIPGWVARELYIAARRDHRALSSVASLALAEYLGISEPPEPPEPPERPDEP